MTLKLYHAEPVANSLKCLIPLKEKGLVFESRYVDLHSLFMEGPQRYQLILDLAERLQDRFAISAGREMHVGLRTTDPRALAAAVEQRQAE